MINNSETTVHETKVNYITSWQWFQIWLGRILLIALNSINTIYNSKKLVEH